MVATVNFNAFSVKGCIVFESNRASLVGHAINAVTQGEFSHTFIFTGIEKGKSIFEANERGVVFDTFDRYSSVDHRLEVYAPYSPHSKVLESLSALYFVYQQKPEGYGWFEVLGNATARLAQAIGCKNFRNPIDVGKICVEVVFDYLELLDLMDEEMLEGFSTDVYSPTDLLNYVKSRPDSFYKILDKPYGVSGVYSE